MAEDGSFAGWLKDVVNSVPILGAYTSAAWGPGNFDPNAAPTKDIFSPDATAMERIGSVINTVPFLHVAGEGVGTVANNFAPLKFVLDFGNRTADSFFTGLQAEDDADGSTSFFDGWKHGWDTWGTEDHLTAGQIVGASLNSGLEATGLSPFTQQGVKDTQALAKQTWYGELAGAATDISAGFIGIPGTGTLRAAREARTINTLADAENVAEAFNSGQRAGRTASLFKPQAPQVHASRLELLSRDTLDHADSMIDAMNYLGPKTGSMNGRGARILAEVAVEAKKLGRDLGEHVMGNAYLASMGSDAARAELMDVAPLIAAKVANGSLAPQVFDNAAKGMDLLRKAYAKDPANVRMDQIMSQVFDTPRKMAEQKALADAVDKAIVDAAKAKELRGRLAQIRPRNRIMVNGQGFDLNADNLTIKESRLKAESQHRDLQAQLAEAKADLAGTKRWAGGAKKTKDLDTVDEFSQALGAAQQRVDDLTQRAAEAKADFELLKSTPLDENGFTLPQWRQDMANARGNARIAGRRRDMLIALNRTAKRELDADARAAREISPSLNASHQWLADLDALGRGEYALPELKLVPSRLDKMKTAFRDSVGASYIYDAGEFNRKVIFHSFPKNAAASIGTAYGRNSVNVLDRYTGMQELGLYLKHSKVFSGDEIKGISEEFLRRQPGQVADYVAKVHHTMLERIVAREAPDLSPEDVEKAVGSLKGGMHQNRSYLTEVSKQADAEGSQWASLHEFPDMDASDAIHRVDAAFLRSHLADTVPFADPKLLEHALKEFQKKGSVTMAAADAAVGGVDFVLAGWKLAQLMRPGLMVRNMLDSNVRAFALMGTVPTVMSTMNGLWHLSKNSKARVGDWVSTKGAKIPGLTKVGMHDPQGVARNVLGAAEIQLGKGKHQVSLYDLLENGDASATSLAIQRTAMTKGMAPSQGLLSWSDRNGARFRENAQVWDIYKADSREWPRAYAQHAQVLLASPTARKIIDWEAKDGLDDLSLQQFTKELFADPAVRDEYRVLLNNHDMTQLEFIEQVVRETEAMFPEPGMAADLLAGKFRGAAGQRWVEQHFPKDQRFDLPGNQSVFEFSHSKTERGLHAGRELVNKVFAAIQDNPDFWLARHPVAVAAFQKQAKLEAARLYQARVAKFGEDAEFTAADIAKIEQRARNHAIGTVRTYMYDATRNTGASASSLMHRLVPFFAPWQDTMRAYSRLIYDDPRRIFQVAGLYNTPFNANTWVDDPFVVDENGNRVHRGQEPEGGSYILIGGKWGMNEKGQRVLQDAGIRLRASSFNTILQGEVPWLPGWGPAVQLPINVALNNNRELALSLASSDNPAIQTLMKSLFMDGEVPVTDENTLYKTMVPSWLRRFADAHDGVAYGRNVAYLMNAKYIESQRTGIPFDYATAYEQAKSEAKAASWPLLISQFGFGISGDAQVQGTFYVQKMHELQALAERPPGGGLSPLEVMYGEGVTPTAAFAQMFPEADGLSWSFTRNETGISATATAQNSALRNQSLIDANPTMGWFIVGADNVGGEWSQTAYNQQKMGTFGAAELGRKQLSTGEMAAKARVSMGWDQFTKMSTALSNYTVAYNLDAETVDAVKTAIIQGVGQENPDWFAEYNNRQNAVQDFYQRADLLAENPALAKRQDIAMYATYRQAMQQVLDSLGLKSLAGTSENSAYARSVMNQIGTQMARQNIGFQQMWDRVLYNDVKPKPTDRKFGYGGVPGAESGTVSDVG